MTTTTNRERNRNYKVNPHTASWLRVFHDANGANYNQEHATDLLDEVPVEAPAYQPSENQRTYVNDLIRDITALNSGAGALALDYTRQRSRTGTWSPERISQWITNLIAKRTELRKAQHTAPVPPTAPQAQVADGRYAIEEEGTLKFFRVKNGRKPGYVFLDIQASDEWHSIRNLTRVRSVLELIAADPKQALARYGKELGQCGRCGRTLTDELSRERGIGPDCYAKL